MSAPSGPSKRTEIGWKALRGRLIQCLRTETDAKEDTMKSIFCFCLTLMLTILLAACQSSQPAAPASAPPAAESTPPMILTGSVPLEGVKGRFDHFASGKGRVFVS